MKKINISILLMAASIVACKTTSNTSSTATAPTPTPTVVAGCTKQYTYTTDIKPVMEKYCTRCHGDAGGFDFTQYEDVKRAGKEGELVGTISYAQGYKHMPAGGDPKLDQSIIDMITCWVNQGMKQ